MKAGTLTKLALRLKRNGAEVALEQISDSHCHLFPMRGGPYPVDCGELGFCLMRWVGWQQRLPGYPIGWESPKPHWEFEWWDQPLNLETLQEEARW